MFTASLQSMILHSALHNTFAQSPPATRLDFQDLDDLADFLLGVSASGDPLPAIIRSRNPWPLEFIGTGPGRQVDGRFAWGRVPAADLAFLFRERRAVSSDEEMVDLGTTLHEHAPPAGSAAAAITAVLASHTATNPDAIVAIIDRGESVTGMSPETFGGRLAQVLTTNLVMSAHALKVLHVLTDELAGLGELSRCELACALVPPPTSQFGPACFAHANSVEMLTSLKALGSLYAGSHMPLLVNMSLGTHVGPHNGDSPLEEYIANFFANPTERALFVSGGNDAMLGVSARANPGPGMPETFKIRSGISGARELLVEFWWEDNGSAPTISLDIADLGGGPSWLLSAASLNANRSGAALGRLTSVKGVQFCSLLHQRAHNGMSCAAVAITSTSPVPAFDVDVTFACTRDTIVNAWIVVSDDRSACFVAADRATTLNVPAADGKAISVAGASTAGQPWTHSSRGPGAEYGKSPGSRAPMLAANAQYGAGPDLGTSYASPRACAHAVPVLLDPSKVAAITSAADLALMVLGRSPSRRTAWNSRTGWGVL